MGELSFSYAPSFERIWPTWQDELGRRDSRFRGTGNVIETNEHAGDFKEAS